MIEQMRRMRQMQQNGDRANAKAPGRGLVVTEQDGAPLIEGVVEIIFDNGTVTDEGDGVVSVTNSGGGGSGFATRYSTDAGQSIVDNDYYIVDFGNETYTVGSGGTVTTGSSWKFTHSGADTVYLVNARCTLDDYAWEGEHMLLALYKNGTLYAWVASRFGPGTAADPVTYRLSAEGDTTILLADTDYIDVRILQNTASTINLYDDDRENFIDIVKVA